jgi:hypothetical protein
MTTADTLQAHCIEEIHSNGFVCLELEASDVDVDNLFKNFAEVLDLAYGGSAQSGRAHGMIEAFATLDTARPSDSAGFLAQRRVGEVNPYEKDPNPSTENKDLLHFTPLTIAKVTEYFRTNGGMPRVVANLLNESAEMHHALVESVRPALGALGVANAILAPTNLQDISNIHLLRAIRYVPLMTDQIRPREGQDSLAELHFDRSKFTIAGLESRPGLVGAPGNNRFGNESLTAPELETMASRALANPIDHSPGWVKLFPGAGYNHLPMDLRKASGELPPLLHGVIDNEPGQERFVIVLFINEHNGLNYGVPSKSETGYGKLLQVLKKQA